jgi:hypothetical protein
MSTEIDYDVLTEQVAKKLTAQHAAANAEITRVVAAESKRHGDEQRALRAKMRVELPSDYKPEVEYDSEALTLTVRFGDHTFTRQGITDPSEDLKVEMALALWSRIQRHAARNAVAP